MRSLRLRPFALRWFRRGTVAFTFVAVASWPLWQGSVRTAVAQDKPDPAAAKATLEQYEKAAEPGPQHELLKPLVGIFSATAVYAGRGGAALTSQGTSTNEMILGGRFLRQEYVGRLQDREFHGLTIIGYDNVTGGYQAVAADEARTGLFYMDGSADADGKTLTFSGQSGDPVSGQVKTFRHVLKIESADKHTLEMYEPDAAGQLQKTVVITYEKVADAPPAETSQPTSRPAE